MEQQIFGTNFVATFPKYCDGRESLAKYKTTLVLIHPDHAPRMLNPKTKRFVEIKGTKKPHHPQHEED